MKYKVGDSLKIITDMFEGIGVYKGATILVVQECETEGQWLDRRGVEADALNTFANGKYFELVEEDKVNKKFKEGDKVISIKNTPSIPEGFIGFITKEPFLCVTEYDYAVESINSPNGSGVVELFREDELELLSVGKEVGFKPMTVQEFSNKLKDNWGTTENKPDVINSPKHYAVFEQVEAIQVIASSMTQDQFYGYCLGNILKYRLRAGGKDDVMQELGKADKYQELYTQHKHLCKGEK